MIKYYLLLIFLFLGFSLQAAESYSKELRWIVSTEKSPWIESKIPDSTAIVQSTDQVEIDNSVRFQTIDGFGGAFNEKGWDILNILPAGARDSVIKALFDTNDGCKFNICRVPIGASDYAMKRYTLDETKDDFKMENFSIDIDRSYLIPYIKAAMKYRPDLKIWGSVWTPPTWMKSSGEFDGGFMLNDPEIMEAFALYLARFIESYQAEGINIYASCIQNEPFIETHYPSCFWTPGEFLTFIRDHMGPLFQNRHIKAGIWLGTLQDSDYDSFPATVLTDSQALKYITAVGYQWNGLGNVARTKNEFPQLKIVQTETECGNWPWRPGYDSDNPQNDWDYGSYTWTKVKEYIKAGVNIYTLWNMVLDQEGKNIDSIKPWPQNSAVVIDRSTKNIIYTPMFYAFKHFSYFVEPGAIVLQTKGKEDVLAFLNPDGGTVLVLQNTGTYEQSVTVKSGDKIINLEMPGRSWGTLKF